MIDQTTLITYLAILLGFVFIPGPAVLLTLARATSSGTRVGIATGFGIAVGDLIHTAMAVFGISALILASAFLFSLVKYLGAAYLIYLGIRAILEKTPVVNGVQTAQITASQAFKQATLAEVLNPKTALFFLAFLPQFVQPENGSVALQLTVLGVLFVMMGLFSTVVVAIGAGGVGKFLRQNPSVLKWQGKVVGGIYGALGIRLALQER
ncbi:MAG: LysE family translocator [Rhizobiaceae bacterium]|nr:LysE family translocator [Rhizobiaceae bacterium]